MRPWMRPHRRLRERLVVQRSRRANIKSPGADVVNAGTVWSQWAFAFALCSRQYDAELWRRSSMFVDAFTYPSFQLTSKTRRRAQ